MTADEPENDVPGDNVPRGAVPDDDELDVTDDALNWDTSSRDASYVEGPSPAREKKPARSRPKSPVAPPVDEPADDHADDPVDDAPAPTSSFLLVTYGILGGVYALYAVGWITTVLRNTITFPDLLGEFMYQLGEFLAIAAAPVWFAAVFAFTRHSKPLVRLLWLLLGLILLVPVPFVLGV